jgi:type IV secretion system protein TrbG
MKKTQLAILIALLPFAAHGQTTVPEIQPSLVAAVDPSGGMAMPPITVTPQERAALDIAKKFIKHTSRPIPAEDGSVQYIFGSSIPTVICTPLYACVVRLQQGEILNSLQVGDKPRWSVKDTMFGSGPAATVAIVIKPHEFNIVTNMTLITDRRIYTIVMKSAQREWMPIVSFQYPEDELNARELERNRQQRNVYSSTLAGGMNVANMDFGYKITGDVVSWKPTRVFSDGTKTYIDFDSIGNEAPVFVEIQSKGGVFTDPETKIVNNRFIGNRLVVDGVPALSALIVGVGSSQRMVTIEKTGGKK